MVFVDLVMFRMIIFINSFTTLCKGKSWDTGALEH